MKRIGIIGFGNMGSSIAERLKRDYQVLVFDKEKSKLANISGLKESPDAVELVREVDIVILAIKPQDFVKILKEIKPVIGDKLVISIAAGISTKFIEKKLGKVRVVRTMPNLAAKIGEGMTCLCSGTFASKYDINLAAIILNNLGQTLVIEEKDMNSATAGSGSGPGFFYYFLEKENIDFKNIPQDFQKSFENSLAEALIVEEKWDKIPAQLLASKTVSGSIALLRSTNLSPQELRNQVTSKGGTTAAGIEVLANGGSLKEAVIAAAKRAEELNRG